MSYRGVVVSGIEHTGLVVADPEALANWYSTHFGASETSRSDDERPIIFLSFGASALIELIPAGDAASAEASDHVHLCLSTDNLDGAIARLGALNVSPVRGPFAAYDGSSVVFFRDPENNLVQLAQRVDGSTIHAAVFG